MRPANMVESKKKKKEKKNGQLKNYKKKRIDLQLFQVATGICRQFSKQNRV